MNRAAVLGALLLGACAGVGGSAGTDRERDEKAAAGLSAALDAGDPDRWVVIQQGRIVAQGPEIGKTLDEAVRSGFTTHRFVFRPRARGAHFHRIAYLPEGGVVAGRAFVEALGLGSDGPQERPRAWLAGGKRLDLGAEAAAQFEVEVADPEGRRWERVRAVYDPAFDGSLLLDRATAERLRLDMFEIPGGAEVEVAFGRPLRANRSSVRLKIEALGIDAAGEVLHPRTN